MIKICHCIALLIFLQGLPVYAQRQIPVNMRGFYENDENAIDKNFDEAHVMLDADSLKYIPYCQDDLYGFVDKLTMAWKVKPKYNHVVAVYPEGAIVGLDGGYGWVQFNDTFVVGPYFSSFEKEGNVYHGMMRSVDTSIENSYSSFTENYYFTEKKYLFTAWAHKQQTFSGSDTMAWFRYGDTFSVYGISGALLRKIPYEKSKLFIGTYNNCLVYLEGAEKPFYFTWYDLQGNLKYKILSPDDRSVHIVRCLNDSVFALIGEDRVLFEKNQDMFYTFTISNGMLFSGMDYAYANLFKEGNMIVVHDIFSDKFGLLSGNGLLKVPCRYSYIGSFINGEAAFADTTTQKIGFIDGNGKVVVPPVFEPHNKNRLQFFNKPMQYGEGLCAVLLGYKQKQKSDNLQERKFGYADRSGKIVLTLPDTISYSGNFSDGVAPVISENRKVGFIDRHGKIVIPFKYDIYVEGAYPFPQVVIPYFYHGYAYIRASGGYIDRAGREYFSGKHKKVEHGFSH